ncbi:MAG: hypothetical protein R8J41_16455 [Alphaproteobacteria bacterium]|nr:hypothetical protein [Alphaproteobacteria bacterium]
MIPCVCFIQEGQIADHVQATLKAKLDAFAQDTFNQPAQQTWITVGKGDGFTEAKPSTSSIVSVHANSPLDQDKRAELLKDLCDMWVAETGCSLNEIVATINDPQA